MDKINAHDIYRGDVGNQMNIARVSDAEKSDYRYILQELTHMSEGGDHRHQWAVVRKLSTDAVNYTADAYAFAQAHDRTLLLHADGRFDRFNGQDGGMNYEGETYTDVAATVLYGKVEDGEKKYDLTTLVIAVHADDASGDLLTEVRPNAAGQYSINGILPGKYVVTAVALDGTKVSTKVEVTASSTTGAKVSDLAITGATTVAAEE